MSVFTVKQFCRSSSDLGSADLPYISPRGRQSSLLESRSPTFTAKRPCVAVHQRYPISGQHLEGDRRASSWIAKLHPICSLNIVAQDDDFGFAWHKASAPRDTTVPQWSDPARLGEGFNYVAVNLSLTL